MTAEIFDSYPPHIAHSIRAVGDAPVRSERRISSWEILNQATPARVQHRLAGLGQSASAIQQAQSLLTSYHRVYRTEWMQQRSRQRGPCQPPTFEQLARIKRQWQENFPGYDAWIRNNQPINTEENILRELAQLAQVLRIGCRTKF